MSDPASESTHGQARPSKKARAKARCSAKPPAKAPHYMSEQVNEALVEWIKMMDDGEYVTHKVANRIRTSNDGKVPYEELMKQIGLVVQLNDSGVADNSAPAAARGKKVTNIAIAEFLDRSVGWVQNCVTVNRLLITHADDPRVKAFMKALKPRAIGVRTVLDGLRAIVNEPLPPSQKGKKRQRLEDEPAAYEEDYDANGYVESE